MELTLTDQQQDGLLKLKDWWNSSSKIFMLCGFAGTGKSTVVKEALSRLEGCKPLLTAPTGKAAKVLSIKSGSEATTIHKAIYSPNNPELMRLQNRLEALWTGLRSEDHEIEGIVRTEEEISTEIQEVEDKLGHLRDKEKRFSLSKNGVAGTNLFLVDECSMVNEAIARDIEQISNKILLIGDPFQLPPVKAKWGWEDRTPDVMLTDVVRQSGDGAGITLAAEAIRLGRQPKIGLGFEKYSRGTLTYSDYMEFDVVLVGSNNMKRTLDRGIRLLKGYEEGMPIVGEKVMCLNNNSFYQVFNGELFTITKILDVDHKFKRIYLNMVDEFGNEFLDLPCDLRVFADHQEGYRTPRDVLQFSFTYASTVHKYQGSEASNVCVIDDWKYGDHDRWLYTAITRAVDSCSLVS